LPPLCLAVSFPCNSSKIIKGGGFWIHLHLHNGEHQRVVVGGSAGTKRKAAAILSDFGFKAKPGAPSPSGRSSSASLPPLLGGGRAKGQERAGARASGPSGGDGVGHGGVWLGSRLGNDGGTMTTGMTGIANCKRSAVMRVCTGYWLCTAGEWRGKWEVGVTWELGAGGSGNKAEGRAWQVAVKCEMEYDGRVAGIGTRVRERREESGMGRSGQWADRGWWETLGVLMPGAWCIDVV
jgi:hypothetical protein